MKKIRIITVFVLLLCVFGSVLLTSCQEEPRGEYVPEAQRYQICAPTQVDDMGYGLLAIFLDTKNTYIELRPDGTMTLRVMLLPGILDLIKGIVDVGSLLADADIDKFLKTYIEPLIPGATIDDVANLFELFRKSIGIGFVGMDFEDENIKALIAAIKGEGEIPADFALPKDFGAEYVGPYYIKQLHSEYTGDYTGVFVGKHHEDSEPFLIMTMEKDEEKKVEKLWFRIEVSYIEVHAERALA